MAVSRLSLYLKIGWSPAFLAHGTHGGTDTWGDITLTDWGDPPEPEPEEPPANDTGGNQTQGNLTGEDDEEGALPGFEALAAVATLVAVGRRRA